MTEIQRAAHMMCAISLELVNTESSLLHRHNEGSLFSGISDTAIRQTNVENHRLPGGRMRGVTCRSGFEPRMSCY